MNLNFLRYFIDTYKLKSVSKASAANNISRTAISKGIKNLESSIGINLIDHKKNQLIFTKDADRIYKQALRVLDEAGLLSKKLESTQKVIKFGIVHSIATGLLADFISISSIDYNIEVLIANPTEINSLLNRYLIDFGVSVSRDSKVYGNEVILHKGFFKLYESADNKYSKKTLYITPDWPEVLELKKKISDFKSKGFDICVIDSWDAIYSVVKKGRGIGLLPDYFKINNKKIKVSRSINFKFSYNVLLKHQNSFYNDNLFKELRSKFASN